MIRQRVFLALVGAEVLALALLALWGGAELRDRTRRTTLNRSVVAALKLTDLALWTEARYTRNPSQADRFSAFQDLPGALEHFPAGSLLAPPRPGHP